MADFANMLAQLFGQREEERPNLNPTAPNTTPGTRGLFGLRPVQGRPALGYGDVAPLPPQWAERGPQSLEAPPELNPFPFPMGGLQPPQVPRAPMPRAARVRISEQDSPGAFGNFANYANATMGLRTSQAPMQASEPWTQPVGTETWALGRPSIGRGMEPPDAEFTLDPAYVQVRGPVNYGGDYSYRNVDRGIDPATGQRVIVGERLGLVRDRLTGQVVTPQSRFAMQDAPESVRRPINRTPPPAPYSPEDEAWAAAQRRARQAPVVTAERDNEREPLPFNPFIGPAQADGRRGRRGRTGGGGW